MGEVNHPIEGQIVLLAGARASVTLTRLSEIIRHAQDHGHEHAEAYDRRFERVDGTDDIAYYLADDGHWAEVGDELDLATREADAVRRAHAEQFRRDGRRLDREEEFDATLEVRDPVAITTERARSNR
jgi:hypothetical protein